MPHLSDRILTPARLTAEGVLFDVPLRPYPGKPIVCMVPRETSAGSLHLPIEVADKYQPDFGVVAKFVPRVVASQFGAALLAESGPTLPGGLDRRPSRSGRVDKLLSHPWDDQLRPGMLVAIKPYTGAWFTHADFPWIPEGRVLKILGAVEDWSENILGRIED